MKKKLTLALVVVLAFALGIGGTVAYLTAQTVEIENVFTVGNVKLTLEETTENYKMVPGTDIAKDPVVTVEGGSEDAWVFVKIEESAELDNYIDYDVASAWTALPGNAGVYYCTAATQDTDNPIAVLADNEVTVKTSVTQAMMDAVTADPDLVTLTFTAYAIQQAGFETAELAWAELNPAA
ncbi:MAG: SipW-dependent-type signal peptide-containing protein [Candidatus Heteroscillospira sp.]|jgi:predicted ribosomally synthesized peptide with SipW-like signal peptide